MASTTLQEHEVAHHFDDLEQEFESQKFGMWLFMASEIMMFGALLVGGLFLLYLHPDAFAESRPHLDWRLGALNTFFLLTGGFTMARAAGFAQQREQGKVRTNLILSLLLACGFLVVKTIEYKAKFHHGLLPGHAFHGEGFTSLHAHIFFGYYFVATGLHALHGVDDLVPQSLQAGPVYTGLLHSGGIRGNVLGSGGPCMGFSLSFALLGGVIYGTRTRLPTRPHL